MSRDWFSLARRVHVGDGCGNTIGGKPRAIHHTTEGGSVAGAVATYLQTGNYPTFTIDYFVDDVVQHLAASIGATAVENAVGGVDTNREGDYCIQIEWIGHAAQPFTNHDGQLIPAGPKVRAFFDWLRDLGIPDVWPMGPPKPYPESYGAMNGDRDSQVWVNYAGHYGHSQVPENHHGDPGAINPAFVKQTAHPASSPVEDDMPKLQFLRAGGVPNVLWVTDLLQRRRVHDNTELQRLIKLGVDPSVHVVSTQDIAAIKDVTP